MNGGVRSQCSSDNEHIFESDSLAAQESNYEFSRREASLKLLSDEITVGMGLEFSLFEDTRRVKLLSPTANGNPNRGCEGPADSHLGR